MNRHSELGTAIAPGEITPRAIFEQRRLLIRAAAAGTFGAALAPFFARSAFAETGSPNPDSVKLAARSNPQFALKEKLTRYKDVTTYNNFYEFGTDKADPAKYAGTLITRPWTVAVEGHVKNPGFTTSTNCSSWPRSKNGSTACAASKAGRWRSPGSACRWPN